MEARFDIFVYKYVLVNFDDVLPNGTAVVFAEFAARV